MGLFATGAFTSNITGLRPGTDYYVRAYATNTGGTSYGTQVFFISAGRLASGYPSSYKVTVTRVEMCNGTWVTIFSGTAQLDTVAGGTFPGISDLSLPAGTYSQIRITFNNSFPVTGTLSHDGTVYYTTATTFGGQTNLDSTPTTVAGDMAEFAFYEPGWGTLNADVTQASAITPVTVGPATDYQPTLRFTINTTLHLKESAGNAPSLYFSLGVPTVSLVEPQGRPWPRIVIWIINRFVWQELERKEMKESSKPTTNSIDPRDFCKKAIRALIEYDSSQNFTRLLSVCRGSFCGISNPLPDP